MSLKRYEIGLKIFHFYFYVFLASFSVQDMIKAKLIEKRVGVNRRKELQPHPSNGIDNQLSHRLAAGPQSGKLTFLINTYD